MDSDTVACRVLQPVAVTHVQQGQQLLPHIQRWGSMPFQLLPQILPQIAPNLTYLCCMYTVYYCRTDV